MTSWWLFDILFRWVLCAYRGKFPVHRSPEDIYRCLLSVARSLNTDVWLLWKKGFFEKQTCMVISYGHNPMCIMHMKYHAAFLCTWFHYKHLPVWGSYQSPWILSMCLKLYIQLNTSIIMMMYFHLHCTGKVPPALNAMQEDLFNHLAFITFNTFSQDLTM